MKKIKDFNYLIGQDFKKSKTDDPYFLFPSLINGRPMIKTLDFNPYRVNISVENDKIIEIINFG